MFLSCSSSRSGRDCLSSGAAPAGFERCGESAGVVAAAQAATLDEERRRDMRTAGDRTGEVALDTLDHRRAVEIRDESIDVEPKPYGVADQILARSEEHTSEVQTLTSITYADSCLKHKKDTMTHQNKQ